MGKILVVNYGEHEFLNFNEAVEALEEQYGYTGLAWDMVAHSNDFDIMCEFLNDDGIDAEIM